MSATNGTGYEVQVYDRRIGWMMETDGYPSIQAAQAAINALPLDHITRRAYESLEGY